MESEVDALEIERQSVKLKRSCPRAISPSEIAAPERHAKACPTDSPRHWPENAIPYVLQHHYDCGSMAEMTPVEGEKTQPEAAQRKSWWRVEKDGLFSRTVVGVTVGILVLIVTKGCDYYNNRLALLEYSAVSSPAVVNKTAIGDVDLHVFSGKREIDNLSTLTVTIANTSSRDFEILKCFFRFFPIGNKPPKLIRAIVLSSTEDRDVLPATTDESEILHCGYVLKAINRGATAIQIQFVFEGAEVPQYMISSGTAGAEFVQSPDVRKRGTWDGIVDKLSLALMGALFALMLANISITLVTERRGVKPKKSKKRVGRSP